MTSQDLDLTRMDLQELRQLRKKVDRAISSYEKRKQRAALSAVEQAAREHGFRLGELLEEVAGEKGQKTRRSAPVGPPKYANPENPEQTWSGRGRRPAWITKALEEGRSLEDLAV